MVQSTVNTVELLWDTGCLNPTPAPHHIRHMSTVYEDSEEDSRSDEVERQRWKTGSKVEVYSASKGTWYIGEVCNITLLSFGIILVFLSISNDWTASC